MAASGDQADVRRVIKAPCIVRIGLAALRCDLEHLRAGMRDSTTVGQRRQEEQAAVSAARKPSNGPPRGREAL
jgi:hypothetical protein